MEQNGADVIRLPILLASALEALELRRVKELESENAKLKRMYMEMALGNAALKGLIAKGSRTGIEA